MLTTPNKLNHSYIFLCIHVVLIRVIYITAYEVKVKYLAIVAKKSKPILFATSYFF